MTRWRAARILRDRRSRRRAERLELRRYHISQAALYMARAAAFLVAAQGIITPEHAPYAALYRSKGQLCVARAFEHLALAGAVR